MANEPILTVVGNLTGDPELRFTPAGKAVAGFTVASTPRTKQGDEWVDGETTWLRCSAWDKLAENVAESLQSGMRVIVQGALSTRTYDKRDGSGKGSSLELRVDAIGPELRWATVKVAKAGQSGGQVQRTTAPAAHDPWAVPGGAGSDAPPF